MCKSLRVVERAHLFGGRQLRVARSDRVEQKGVRLLDETQMRLRSRQFVADLGPQSQAKIMSDMVKIECR